MCGKSPAWNSPEDPASIRFQIMFASFFHPALLQLIRVRTRAKLRSMVQSSLAPRRAFLTLLVVLLGLFDTFAEAKALDLAPGDLVDVKYNQFTLLLGFSARI